ncbi:antibiotic biosynthesis monooxygenase [Photobacterium makurazakiensis]|uniref:antibiotic biosynthesis monooxygenase family protein n=1 Tax=Photobacterium makurazakiensis TaxID=2910234 RepID=UPI003D0ABF78
MIAVIFEVHVFEDKKDDYIDIAASIKPMLEQIDGFISVERFKSLSDESKILSLSFWRDEESVARWRNLAEHKEAQRQGKEAFFDKFRIRVASVVRDYDFHANQES